MLPWPCPDCGVGPPPQPRCSFSHEISHSASVLRHRQLYMKNSIHALAIPRVEAPCSHPGSGSEDNRHVSESQQCSERLPSTLQTAEPCALQDHDKRRAGADAEAKGNANNKALAKWCNAASSQSSTSDTCRPKCQVYHYKNPEYLHSVLRMADAQQVQTSAATTNKWNYTSWCKRRRSGISRP